MRCAIISSGLALKKAEKYIMVQIIDQLHVDASSCYIYWALVPFSLDEAFAILYSDEMLKSLFYRKLAKLTNYNIVPTSKCSFTLLFNSLSYLPILILFVA